MHDAIEATRALFVLARLEQTAKLRTSTERSNEPLHDPQETNNEYFSTADAG